MDYVKRKWMNTDVQISSFRTERGINEYHILITANNPSLPFLQQLNELAGAYHKVMADKEQARPVFRRYFMSDAANQYEAVESTDRTFPYCANSFIQQPPLNGTKIALWVYALQNITTQIHPNGVFEASHNGYHHLWSGSLLNRTANPELQTRLILKDYIRQLAAFDCTLAKDCIRTWFFVQNVDVNYTGVVKGRKDIFDTEGLTEETHYITSTGIEGRNTDPGVFASMDAYSVKGLAPEQIQILYAPTHLNPTHEYGVTFERGVSVTYGDRKHIFIAGTASIDNRGEIVHTGDILKQTQRMLENISILIREADGSMKDIVQSIIYLRDTADYHLVKGYIDRHYPELPHLIVLAPVCRAGWLIEMECIAISPTEVLAYACL